MKPKLDFDPGRLLALHRTYRAADARFIGHREAARTAREQLAEVQRSAAVSAARAADLPGLRETAARVQAEGAERVERAREALAEADAMTEAAVAAKNAARATLKAAVEFAAGQGIAIPDAIDLRELVQ